MNRSKQITIAVGLLVFYSLFGAIFEIPNLAKGTAVGPDEAPFFMTVFNFAKNICGLFAAYGLWKNMRWGKILTLIIMALSILYTLLPVLFAPLPLKLLGLALIAINIVIIVLVLRNSPKLSTS